MKKDQYHEIFLDYLARYKDKLESREIGVQSLAKLICAEMPALYSDKPDDRRIEFARSRIRYFLKANLAGFTLNNDNYKSELAYKMSIPESQAEIREDYELPPGRFLIMSDIHLPYHVKSAVEFAIEKGRRRNIDAVYLNGDVIDMYMISNFVKTGFKPDMMEEFNVARQFFGYLRERFPKQEIYYKLGNHEARWETYIWTKAPELAKLLNVELGESLGLFKLLKTEEFGIIPIQSTQLASASGLGLLHGHEFGKSVFNPVNPARGAFLRGKSSVLIGHHHQTSTHSESNLKHEKIVCYSTGCLCELNPKYMPFASLKWNHGAAEVEHNGRDFEVENYRIDNGKINLK